MFSGITKFIIRFRWVTLAFWIAIAAIIVSMAPNLSEEANKSQQQANSKSNEEAQKATQLISREFSENSEEINNSITMTFFREGGLKEEDSKYAVELEKYLNGKKKEFKLKDISSPYSNEQLSSTLISKDKEAALMLLNVTITNSKKDATKWLEESNEVIPKLRSVIEVKDGDKGDAPAIPSGLELHLTGGNAMTQEIMGTQGESLSLMLMLTIILVLVVLLVIYRSPIAAFFPLLAVGFSLVISQGVLAFAAKAGLSVTPAIMEFLLVILFGAGTDYCLLIVSRFKEGILDGLDAKEALCNALPSAGEAIVSSAFAVIIAFACMVFADSFVFRALGPGVAIAVFTGMLVIITFIPAIIALLGEKIFWPFLPSKKRNKMLQKERAGRQKKGIWEKIADSVVNKPSRYIICTLIMMIPFIIVVSGFKYDNDELSAMLPKQTDSYKGIQVMTEHFGEGAGKQNATTIIIKTNQNLWDTSNLRVIEELSENLMKLDGVHEVSTVTRPSGKKITLDMLAQSTSQSSNTTVANTGGSDYSIFALPGDYIAQFPAIKDFMKSYISDNKHSVLLSVELNHGPYSNEAIDTISGIRDTMHFTLNNTDLHDATAYVGGVTAGIKDLLDIQRNDFIFIIIIVTGAIYIILALLMRSLVAPLYMVGTIVLSFATTMGITYAIFKYGFGYDGLVSTVPIYGFVILIALGVDYNIFLMSRIRYEYESGKATAVAIRDGLSVTGSIITSCGIIMAGTFAAFLISPMKTFLELGVAIVVGLILDTFIIRTLLVPSIAIKIGEMNWWPKRKIRVTSESRTKQI
ncbi:MMPL family transporter [Bacillus mobilis]|uniref:SSD domain-containing protein n=2 Tax=Bacillus cereus group TaxID=86661 RepID=A0A1C4CKX3_BACCE|nr:MULTISPECIES: MMPL family transporter [Bacillus cereus group]MCU5595860.1 MMPL family transporter [Bacillus mobilis]MCU5739461.1 MMPL family transporter [Bacillus mobilis]MCU9561150.1 MMPL family transporter [Bacillus mobilis]OKA37562.1 hypothetical protein BJR06_08820 [Bacillus cereus]OKA40414.1 hypothetical protein BJR07_00440 [Bacillus cereus]